MHTQNDQAAPHIIYTVKEQGQQDYIYGPE